MTAVVESRATKLSLAVLLMDDYTKEQPIGTISISLKDRKNKAIKNPSGYYLFLDLQKGKYTIQVETDFYFDSTLNVQVPPKDKDPLKKIVLNPNPAYPFPPGTTLIRGKVLDAADKGVPNAVVEISEKNLKTSTSQKGEFVIYFSALKDADIIKEKGKRFLKTENGKSLKVEATSNSHSGKAIIDEVEEGAMNPVSIELNISS